MTRPVAPTAPVPDTEEATRRARQRQADRRQWQLIFVGMTGLAMALAVCAGVVLTFAR